MGSANKSRSYERALQPREERLYFLYRFGIFEAPEGVNPTAPTGPKIWCCRATFRDRRLFLDRQSTD